MSAAGAFLRCRKPCRLTFVIVPEGGCLIQNFMPVHVKVSQRLSEITISGARQHNLQNINVKIPRNTLTVITGLSGSGKSSLAFDTIYAEGQRR